MQLLRQSLVLSSTLITALTFVAQITAQTLTTLHHFTGPPNDGAMSVAGVVIGRSGALYGTTTYGGATDCFAGCGTIFELTPPASAGSPWPETLYLFPGHHAGLYPLGGVVLGDGAVLYGTSGGGACGNSSCGMVFSLTPPPSPGGPITRRVLHNFAGSPTDGTGPSGSLVIGSDGTLYGVTEWGGANCLSDNGCGTVFSLTPPVASDTGWTEKVLYSFTGVTDGSNPRAGLAIGPHGVLYGTTSSGGDAGNYGTVFSLTPPATSSGAWSEAVLHSFAGGSDGAFPVSPVVIGDRGVLYSTTHAGGASTCGIVFGLTPPMSQSGAWTENILYTFTGHNDGCNPDAGVVLGSGGVLYGAATTGGASRWGTLFSLHPPASHGVPWTQTVLYTFTGTTDGGDPYGVVLGPNGALYGTTSSQGGATCIDGCGTVFVLRP